jgi:hypothetical protein
VISLGKMHPGQIKAYWALKPHRYKILRCGRRFGKTEFAKIWIGQGLLQGWECAWLAPQHKIWSEAYMEIKGMVRPLWESGSMGSSVIRLKNRGRLDFWTLGNEIAGRSRRYRRVVIDEAAFAKNGDNKVDGSMMEIWEKAIKPTLFGYGGEVLICSNSAGKNPDNFFYNICTDRSYGFGEFHSVVLNCMIASQVQRIIRASYALPTPLGMAGRFQHVAFRGCPVCRADSLNHGQNPPV